MAGEKLLPEFNMEPEYDGFPRLESPFPRNFLLAKIFISEPVSPIAGVTLYYENYNVQSAIALVVEI